MRAGLLSRPEVIQRINRQFVSTTLPYNEMARLADTGNELAREVKSHWTTPLVLLFLSPEGRYITKLSSLKELCEVHPDTSRRPEAPQYPSPDSEVNNARVFLKHVSQYFPDQANR